MVELNGCAPRAIHVLGPQQFTIGDTSSFSAYESFGWCTQVKQPKTLQFMELEKANRCPGDIAITDYGKMDHVIALHTAVLTLDRFMDEIGHVPRPWNEEDAGIFVQMAREVSQSIDEAYRPAELNETVLKTFAMTCCGEICPITAAFGGIAGQEVLKACSGKFTPIRQFLYYDAFEALPPRGDHGIEITAVIIDSGLPGDRESVRWSNRGIRGNPAERAGKIAGIFGGSRRDWLRNAQKSGFDGYRNRGGRCDFGDGHGPNRAKQFIAAVFVPEQRYRSEQGWNRGSCDPINESVCALRVFRSESGSRDGGSLLRRVFRAIDVRLQRAGQRGGAEIRRFPLRSLR